MADARASATAIMDFAVGSKDFKADVVGCILDDLIGMEPGALVHGIKGLPAEFVEMVSDGVVIALKDAVKKKMGG